MRKFGKYERMPDGTRAKQPEPKSMLLQTYLTSLLGLVICVTMFFGTSYAWFTSEVTNTGNEIYIGTLDVELDKKNGAGWESLSAVTNGVNTTRLYTNGVRWEPGYTSLETLRVTDKGNLAFDYKLTFTDGKLDGDPAGNWQDVAKWFDVWVFHNAANEIPTPGNYSEITATGSGWVPVGTLAEVLAGKSVFEGAMEEADVFDKETAHTYTIALHMNGEAVEDAQKDELNALMGKKLELSVKLIATQKSSEKDGFNNSGYDNVRVVATKEALQEELNNATGDVTFQLADDITGDLNVTQKEGTKITIDGGGKSFTGSITIDGKSAAKDTAALTVQNVNFTGLTGKDTAYIKLGVNGDSNTRYTNHVTVKNCTFSSTGELTAAIQSYTGGDKNLTIIDCTVNAGMHSFLQVKNVSEGLKIVNCKVYSKNGANLNNTYALEMSKCTFDVKGYAVRFGEGTEVSEYKESYTISDCTLKSACTASDDAVIVFRGSCLNATLNLTNTTLEGKVKVMGNTDKTVINGLN